MQSSTPKDNNYFFQEWNEPESDKLSSCVTKDWKAIVGLVFRNGVTNEIYQFISFIIYLLHVDFVAMSTCLYLVAS